jgi:hypothetical protein
VRPISLALLTIGRMVSVFLLEFISRALPELQLPQETMVSHSFAYSYFHRSALENIDNHPYIAPYGSFRFQEVNIATSRSQFWD